MELSERKKQILKAIIGDYIRTAEPVALHLLDAGGIPAVAQQRAHDKTDAAVTLAALADEHEHLLSLGGWQQTVA